MLILNMNGMAHYADTHEAQEGGMVGILLAAGHSSRFGSDKLLHPLRSGMPMGLASALHLRAVVPNTIAVVSPHNTALSALFAAHHIKTTIAEDADDGMGASLAAGIAATAEARGWVLALGDMPYIHPQTVERVADVLRGGGRLAAPSYHGQIGYPIGFSAGLRKALLAQHGDEDAHDILLAHADELLLLECEDPGIFLDIDLRLRDADWRRNTDRRRETDRRGNANRRRDADRRTLLIASASNSASM